MGLFDFLGGKKDSGRDAGNALNLSTEDSQLANAQLRDLLTSGFNEQNAGGVAGTKTATGEVQNNSILGQLFGNNGTLGRTAQEEQNLSSRGYSLQPEDYEAYGQASDQIARNFGQQENGLAQALSNRGLSQSGQAAQGFSGLQGNKMEMLAQSQRQIANDRMQKNMERLGQTRQFLTSLGGQAESAINQQYGRQLQGVNTEWQQKMDKNNAAQSRLGAMQNAANEDLSQRQQTQQQQGWASALQGLGNTAEKGAMAYATGGLSAAGGGGALSAAKPNMYDMYQQKLLGPTENK